MKRNKEQSVLLRAGAILAGITLLALVSMVSTIIIAETARGDAAAINMAGSLRMQAFRIATAQVQQQSDAEQRLDLLTEVEEFDRRLNSTALLGAIPSRADHPIREAHAQVEQRWRSEMKPMVLDTIDDPLALYSQLYYGQLEAFNADIDTLVVRLQQGAETRILMLRLLQGAAIFLTFILIFFAMHLIYTRVVLPLRELLEAARRAQHGDLTGRVSYTSNNEIGLLGSTFNTMAGNLEEQQRYLEHQVQEKTHDLRQSNTALRLLFDTAQALSVEHLRQETLEKALEHFADATSVDRARLILEQGTLHTLLGVTHLTPHQLTHAELCAETGREAPADPAHSGLGTAQVPAVTRLPVQEGNQLFGTLVLEYDRRLTPSPWLVKLAEALADQLGIAFARAARHQQESRLALMEERSVIARELHDSLAQSLSYLKIQALRLQRLNDQNPEGAAMQPVLGDLREGLNESYRHLRQLLSNFRLQMNDRGLEEALRNSISEFEQRSALDISLDFRLEGAPLDSNAEIHVLQVAREALANVVQHARATRAQVRFKRHADGVCTLTVDDDGIGIPTQFEKVHHYGTRIMQERAIGLNGELRIGAGPLGGTRVRLEFPKSQPQPAAGASA